MTRTLEAGLDFSVRRDDWSKTRFSPSEAPADLAPGRVLFRVDRAAFTANNISYAAAGDMLRYWDFFPDEAGWGRIPTMGYADVVASTHPDVAEGTRCWGFYPISRYLVIEPDKATAVSISDGAAHRQGLAAAYNNYAPIGGDVNYSPDYEDHDMLFRGLFMTSFLCDDFMREEDFFGATRVVIGSASSKTAIVLAHLLAKAGGIRVVGLTSPGNADFVRGLGLYDDVILYENTASIEAGTPTVYVDMAGNGDVTAALHQALKDDLRYDCTVGATHWSSSRTPGDLPGPKPEFFFAPGQIAKRSKEWGPEGLQQRMAEAWLGFRDGIESWLEIRRSRGEEAVSRVYADTLGGRVAPNVGNIISLWDAS